MPYIIWNPRVSSISSTFEFTSFVFGRETLTDRKSEVTALAHLFGPFRVISSIGDDISPRGQIGRALLAVILVSPDQTCTRQSLVDMFWSASSNDKARSSLRSVLSSLRKDLKILGRDTLIGDTYSVHIDPRRLRPAPATDLPFLQNFDLSSKGSEEFEDWLRTQRQRVDSAGTPRSLEIDQTFARPNSTQENSKRVRAIGVLPCRLGRPDAAHHHSADHIIDLFLHALMGTVDIKIFDYRETIAFGQRDGEGWAVSNGPGLMLRPHVNLANEMLTLQVLESRSQAGLMKGTIKCPLTIKDSDYFHVSESEIARCVEQLIEILDQSYGEEETLLSPYQALISIFRLKPESLDEVQSLVTDSLAAEDRPYLHSINCYLSTVRIGEDYSFFESVDRDGLLEMTRQALEPDPFQAFNYAMAGFTLSYVLGEKDLGVELTKQATEIAPDQAFCWDQYALCLFCLGEFDPAFQAALNAQSLGAHSPIRYTYDTTAAIIAFARGDYAATVKYGNRAIFRMPQFTSALKYTAAALGHINQLGDSRRLGHQMRMIGRMASLSDAVNFGGLPSSEEFRERLKLGLERAGVR